MIEMWIENELYFDTLEESEKDIQVEEVGTRSQGHLRIKSSHDSGPN